MRQRRKIEFAKVFCGKNQLLFPTRVFEKGKNFRNHKGFEESALYFSHRGSDIVKEVPAVRPSCFIFMELYGH